MGAVADFFEDPWGTITDGIERGLGYIEDVFDADEWAHDPFGQLVTIVGSPASREVYEGLKDSAEDLAHNLGLGGKDTDSGGVSVAAAKSPAADSLAETGGGDKDKGGTVVPDVENRGNVGGEGSGNNGAGGNRAAALVGSGLVSQGAGTFGFTEPDDASRKAVQKLGA